MFKINDDVCLHFLKILNVNVTNTMLFFDGKMSESFAVLKFFYSISDLCSLHILKLTFLQYRYNKAVMLKHC